MKKISLILLTLIIIFSFKIDIKADCYDEELNEWATTVEVKFIENTSKNFGDAFKDNDYAYFLTITPMRDDIYIKAIDGDGIPAMGEKFASINLYAAGGYTNLEKETYKIEVYGAENSKCKNQLLRSLSYTIGPFNDMIKTEECEEHPDHELCQTFTDKTQNMTREEFNKEIKKYEKEIAQKGFTLSKLFKTIGEYSIYILFPFFIITLIYVVKIKKYQKKVSRE